MFSQLVFAVSAFSAIYALPYDSTSINPLPTTNTTITTSASNTAGSLVGHLTAPEVITNPIALGWYKSDLSAGTKGVQPSNTYKCFSGRPSDFPTVDQWINFNDMWALNLKNTIDKTKDSATDKQAIHDAIVQVSIASKVDARLILAAIIQESGGDVHVPCTGYAHQNCGLMQGDFGSISYDPNNAVQSISTMIQQGTWGPPGRLGYIQHLNGDSSVSYTHCPAGNPYAAARAYNSGSCSTGGNLNCAQYGTASYSNDIANRLLGWDNTNSPQRTCSTIFPVGCVGK